MTATPASPRLSPPTQADDASVLWFPVADGAWVISRDGATVTGAFVLPAVVTGSEQEVHIASWVVVPDSEPSLQPTGTPRSNEQAEGARLAVERYLRRCEAGDWVTAIWETWSADKATLVSVDYPHQASDVDAIVAEGLRWATAQLPGSQIDRGFRTTVRSMGRVACVLVNGLPWGSAVYLVVQSSEEALAGHGLEADRHDWLIVSTISLSSPAPAPAGAGLAGRASEGSASEATHLTTTPRSVDLDGAPGSSREQDEVASLSSGAIKSEVEPSHRAPELAPVESGWHLSFPETTFARVSLPGIAFALSLLVFAFTRFWRLEDFPVYFHGDEAFQVVAARRLIENGFRNELGVPFPFYFSNGGTWAPLITTYLHVVTTTLLGMSVNVSRGTTALASVVGCAALALFARDSLRVRTWWALPLLLASVPTWFLHSRTTFETAYCVAGYAVFLWCYGRYRDGGPRWGALSVFAAAFTFYTYTNGQLIIGATGAMLLVLDAPHHWRMRHQVGWILAAVAISAVPYLAYTRAAPGAPTDQLWRVSSYLVQDISATEKIRQFVLHYGSGLDPRYWFIPNPHELSRHAMLGYGYVPTWFLPFAAVGLAAVVLGTSRPEYRLVVVALLATPVGAGLASVGITRVLAMVIPLTLLTHLGLDGLLDQSGVLIRRLASRSVSGTHSIVQQSTRWVAFGGAVLCIGLAVPAFAMAGDALENGPIWHTDYGLYGQQWGAVQVFREVNARALESPDDTFFVSSTWANGTDLYLPFFVPQLQEAGRVRMGNVRDLLSERRELTRNMVWVMTADEVVLAQMSKRFRSIDVDSTLPYPNGAPGFSFARLEYVSNVEEVVAAERAARIALRSGQAVVDNERLAIRHSLLDGGGLSDIFDKNPRTLGRFNGGNPATLEWAFSTPRTVSTVVLAMTAGSWHVSLALLRPTGEIEIVERDIAARDDPVVTLDVPEGIVGAIRLMITSRVHTDEAIIHLRDVTWQ